MQTLIYTAILTVHSQPFKCVMKPLEIHMNMEAMQTHGTCPDPTMNQISIREAIRKFVCPEQEVKDTSQVYFFCVEH